MQIIVDDLNGPEIAALIAEHLQAMRATSPPESTHALALESLRQPEIAFYTAWQDGVLLGCGALKALSQDHGEVKSMRTAANQQRQGVAASILGHMIGEASQRGYRRLSLETGAMDYFAPARRLYARFGFLECPAFADYRPDVNSVFMTKEI
jgi:putative acetyltransferase